MLLVVLIPIIFAMRDWNRRRLACRLCSRMLSDLAEVRYLVRSSVMIPAGSPNGIFALAGETTEQGMRIGSAFAHGAVWMRMMQAQAQKLGKLSGLWLFRMAALILLALCVRFYLAEDALSAVSGTCTADRLMMITGSGFLVLCSLIFQRLVPDLHFDADGILSGMSGWLRSRIATENGSCAAGWSEVREFETDEKNSGISRSEDKTERLDSFWQRQVQQLESAGERALDLMPLAEFAGFGIFVLCLLLEPMLQLGLFD